MSTALPNNEITVEMFYTLDSNSHELYDGVLVNLAHAGLLHQRVGGRLYMQLFNALRHLGCEPIQEINVHLTKESKSVYVPDLVIICDKDKDKETLTGFEGAPTIVIEIWSPSNMPKEMDRKRDEYCNAGVKEFWEIYLERQAIVVSNTETSTKYYTTFKEGTDSIYFPGLHIDLSEVTRPIMFI